MMKIFANDLKKIYGSFVCVYWAEMSAISRASFSEYLHIY